MKPKELTGKVALITGASKGLGKAMALALAEAGAKLALVSRDEKLLAETAAAIAVQGAEAGVFPADVSEETQVLALEKAVAARFGRIHILINNAGINLRKPVTEFTLEEWNRIQAVNVTGAFLMCRSFVPHLIGQGYGRILNMSSMMSLLSLQSNALKNPGAVAALREARDRMRSMAVLYDRLYRSENLREMSLKDYLPLLVDEIVGVFPNRDLVKVGKKVDDIVLGVKVLSPLGIIVNELITNAMKHAFTGRESGSINVSASAKDGRVTLIVEDDGNGIPESVDIANSSGFGLQLVDMLTAQIDGTIRIERLKGTRFVLEFDA